MSIREDVDALRARTDRIDPRELDALWARLEPCRTADLVGYRWRGFAFDTGHRTGSLLEKARWYGKAFASESSVQPLLCRDESGKLFSDIGTSTPLLHFKGEVAVQPWVKNMLTSSFGVNLNYIWVDIQK